MSVWENIQDSVNSLYSLIWFEVPSFFYSSEVKMKICRTPIFSTFRAYLPENLLIVRECASDFERGQGRFRTFLDYIFCCNVHRKMPAMSGF